MREAEIVRLGEEATRRGANADAMALQHRCEAQESLILQLTEQVTSLQMLTTTIWRTCSPVSLVSQSRAWHGSHPHAMLGLHDS